MIVRKQYQDKAKQIFQGSKIKITTEGHRHLGLVIGSKNIQRKLHKRTCFKMA